MKTNNFALLELRLSVLASSLVLAFGSSASFAADELTQLTQPENEVSLGVASVNKDNQRFGMYNGLKDKDAYGLVDVAISRRDNETGTWLTINGRNLGISDSREMRLDYSRQGQWGGYFDYSETPRFSQYTVNTRVSGIGTTSQGTGGAFLNPTVQSIQLDTLRKTVQAGGSMSLGQGITLQIKARSEDKEGSRLFGHAGTNTPLVSTSFLAEPIDSKTNIVEAIVGFTGEKLQLTGGYQISTYENANNSLVVNGITNGGSFGGVGSNNDFSPIALPPDNEAQQLYLAGGYNISDSTRAMFRVSYTDARQDEAFIPVTTTPTAGTSLDGRVETSVVDLGVTSRPMQNLSLLAKFRYEDRNDKTPIRQYRSTVSAGSSWDGKNEPRSLEATALKLEAAYQLPDNYKVIGGVELDERKRNTSEFRVVSYREKVEERTYRIELKRLLSETLTGGIAYLRSDRAGSDFATNVVTGGAVGSNLIAPVNLADRTRDKVRLSADWSPIEAWSIQFLVEAATDKYDARTADNFGIDKGDSNLYSVDTTYQLNDDWRLSGWLSQQSTSVAQRTRSGTTVWTADVGNESQAIGVGANGKITSKIDLGAKAEYSSDVGKHLLGNTGATVIPDISYKHTTLNLFGSYAIQSNTGVRLDYQFDKTNIDDWTWRTFTYADGTTVTQNPKQTVHFIGISGYYKWW